ncbi:TPA: single-stranded DNA-binding protein, partial [Proteus mirabilis]|nr:single-stranded DNA-binding protein [Proteus mirabilis]HEK3039294.1 single-stranded DNA-binding protein [Proteus mirabilis]HEK3208547.1 single-stranded DNA-binding protein [Proteus mirabilis]
PAQQNPPPAQPQAQSSQPPMDFDDDIPFAPIGLPYPRHAIYVI